MTTLQGAKESPRIEKETLYWYEGNTFTLTWTLNLKDKLLQEPIIISPEDTVSFNFYNANGNIVYSKSFTNIEDNTVDLNFDKETTSRFKTGEYTYCITYNGEYITTIGAVMKIVVEKCH